MDKKLVVFPNDSLLDYFNKGEIKDRYFNPKNWFEQIDVISLFDTEIEAQKVQKLAGSASFRVHKMGKANLSNYKSFKNKVISLISEIQPSIIRAYNPLIQGWVATKIGKELGIPIVISLMADYDRDLRYFAKKNKDLKSYLKLSYTKIVLESYSIKNADEVIIIYEFIRKYAQKMGAKNINLIYNRVDLSQFSPKVEPAFRELKPIIICVGRLMKEKNQECLIRAIKDLDVILLLIGDGVQYQELYELTKKLNIEKKVRFERSILHKDINKYFTSSDIFALPIKYGGFAIPVLEAAASGIPVILPKQEFDSNPELINNFAMLVENNPQSFKDAISKIIAEKNLRDKMVQKGLEVVEKINSDIMEEKEKDLYLKLIKNY